MTNITTADTAYELESPEHSGRYRSLMKEKSLIGMVRLSELAGAQMKGRTE